MVFVYLLAGAHSACVDMSVTEGTILGFRP